MWRISRITLSYGSHGVFDVPCLTFGPTARFRLDFVKVFLTESRTNQVVELVGSAVYANHLVVPGSMHYRDLINIVDSYKPYGFIPDDVVSDGSLNCLLVAVDDLSYRFLGYVKVIKRVRVGQHFYKENAPCIDCAFLDEDRSLIQLSPSFVPAGIFPLLQCMLHAPEGWRMDGRYYFWRKCDKESRFTTNGEFAYRVDFVDEPGARAFIAKATVEYGKDPIGPGWIALSKIAGL